MKSGEFKTLSIRETFEQAHNIETVVTESFFEEYGIKRLLVSFFMDWVRPESDDKLKDIYRHGYFDMISFDDYVKTCEEKGDVFNLFSIETPFLQTRYDKELDETRDSKGKVTNKIVGIENLFYDLPSNTNHIFFYKDYNKITPSDAFRGLCAISPFLYAMGGEGYCGSVNGDSPYYFWIKGNNLYQEIIINSISVETWYNETQDVIPYVDGVGESVIWRRKVEVKKKEPFENISLLEGLTFMGRRLTLIPNEETGYIDKISIQPSSKFLNSASIWRDPHCSYTFVEKKNEILKITNKPNEGDKVWLNGEYIYLFNSKIKPLTFLKFGDFNDENDARLKYTLKEYGLDKLDIVVYGGYNPGGKGIYKWWVREEVKLNTQILDNKKLSAKYIEGLKCVKSVAKCIKSSRSLLKDLNINLFYDEAQEYIETIYVDSLINSNKLNSVLFELKESLIKMAIKCYETELENYDFSKKLECKIGKDTEILDSYEIYYRELYSMVSNCKKELGIGQKSKKKKGEN